ncbi:tetratricopeptide repeat protein, partial [bacterium]|nr:tetratricopeptide repeat protein [bacterium]
MAKVSVEQALAKAKSHIKKGETAEAQALYVTILNAFPHNKKAQQALATLGGGQRSAAEQGPPQAVIDQLMGLYKQGQLELVVDQTQDLTVQFPKTITLWNMLGASAAQIGKLDQAVQAFEQIISLNPNQANAYFNMGNALKDQGKLEEAIVAYNKALAIKPDYEAALNNVVVALKKLGKTGEKRLKKVLETYNKAQALKTENSNSYFSRALALQEQGKLEEAIVAYNKALA